MTSYLTTLEYIKTSRERILLRDRIDIRAIYCLHTGRRVGTIDADSMLELVDSLEPSVLLDDETFDDELLTRCISFARPSPVFAKLNPDTLNRLRVTQPRALLAYLANRFYHSALYGAIHKQTFESRYSYLRDSIRLSQHLDIIVGDMHPVDINAILLALLELDSTFGLQNINPPARVPHIATVWDRDSLDAFIEALQSWVAELRLEAFKRSQQGDAVSASANRATRTAFVRQFVETAPKPESKTRTKRLEREAREKSILDTLDAIISGKLFESPTPVPAGAESKPTVAGVTTANVAVIKKPGAGFTFKIKGA